MDLVATDRRLKAAGHSVETFDLPGMGDDHTSASEVSLDSYAGRVCEVLAASSEPAIVVGHSMGGIVATQAAARCPARVAALVYVAAFLPKDGQSLLDLTKLPECDGEQPMSSSKESLRSRSCRQRLRVSRCTGPSRRTLRRGRSHGSARNRSRRCRWQYPSHPEPSTASTGITCCVRGIGLSRRHCSGGWSPRTCAPTSLSLTQITRPSCR
jgi:pimeloyl-ACP methyl ester carboxylesterase